MLTQEYGTGKLFEGLGRVRRSGYTFCSGFQVFFFRVIFLERGMDGSAKSPGWRVWIRGETCLESVGFDDRESDKETLERRMIVMSAHAGEGAEMTRRCRLAFASIHLGRHGKYPAVYLRRLSEVREVVRACFRSS